MKTDLEILSRHLVLDSSINDKVIVFRDFNVGHI